MPEDQREHATENEQKSRHPSEREDGATPKNLLRKRYSPAQLLTAIIGFFIFIVLLTEASEVLLLLFHLEISPRIGLVVHSLEVVLLLASAYLLLYLPLKQQWRQRLATERALQESEERLRLALEGTKSGLWDWDLRTGAAYYSPSGERVLGYLPGELSHSIETWEALIHPDDHDSVMEALNAHLDGSKPFYETEHRLRSTSGEWVWFHAMGRVTARDAEGRPLRMVGTFNNVHARKRAEEEIHLLSRHLIDLSEKERKLIARDLHDQLGQLVTALQLGMELLRGSLRQEKQIELCHDLIGQIAQLSDHIRDVAGRLRPTALDVGLVPALEYDLKRYNTHLDFRVTLEAPGLEQARFDPEIELTLYRVCQEAVNNAVKHANAQRTDIRLRKQGHEILLEVKDDGLGFEPEQLSQGVAKGWGFGLVGMRERVHALGGHLEILSSPGQGTTIRAVMPQLPKKAEGTAP